MRNLRMEEKLKSGDCLDVWKEGTFDIDERAFRLDRFVEDVDYCDAETELWIWSIGRKKSTGVIYASTGTRFYQNPGFECLFLR